jgi:phosphoribosylformylglycinamidine synthase
MVEIEILTKKGFKNSHGEHILSEIGELATKGIIKVKYSPLYLIDGDIDISQAKMLAVELLSDKITESYALRRYSSLNSKDVNLKAQTSSSASSVFVIEVWYKKGVTDTVAESVVKAIKDLGIDKHTKVRTARKYYLYGVANQIALNNIATKLLANTLVQEYKMHN